MQRPGSASWSASRGTARVCRCASCHSPPKPRWTSPLRCDLLALDCENQCLRLGSQEASKRVVKSAFHKMADNICMSSAHILRIPHIPPDSILSTKVVFRSFRLFFQLSQFLSIFFSLENCSGLFLLLGFFVFFFRSKFLPLVRRFFKLMKHCIQLSNKENA